MTKETTTTTKAADRTRTITLPPPLHITNRDGGFSEKVDLADMPTSILEAILENGAVTVLLNTYNSGGKEKEPAKKLEQLRQRIASWKNGVFVTRNYERGANTWTIAAGVLEDRKVAALSKLGETITSRGLADWRKAIIAQTFGEKEKQTAENFVKAIATAKAKALSQRLAMNVPCDAAFIDAYVEELMDEYRATRKEVATIDLNVDDIM